MEKPESERITMNIDRRLPQHIIEVIFSKIPIMYLPACRNVCKSWNDLVLNYASTYKISPHIFFLCTPNSSYIHCMDLDSKHLERMNFDALVDCDGAKIVDSCNGLLLIFKFSCPDVLVPGKHEFGILNPMTNEYIKLPTTSTAEDYNYGFGFSPKRKCYKVARVCSDGHSTDFEILSFGGSKQWSFVDRLPYYICNNGVYFNGALYWIGSDIKNGHGNFIFRLDVEDEKIVTTISLTGADRSCDLYVGAFNGSIYATVFCVSPFYKLELWMLQRYGGEDLWTREIVISVIPEEWVLNSWTFHFELIKVYKHGDILGLVNSWNLILYNRKIGSIEPLNLSEKFSCICHIESLNFGSLQKILTGTNLQPMIGEHAGQE